MPRFKKVLSLNPSHADAHERYARILRASGKLEQALSEVKRAYELDPLPAERAWLLVASYYWVERLDDSLEVCTKLVQTHPEFWLGHFGRAILYSHKGDREEAFRNLQIVRRLTKQEPYSDIQLKGIQARLEAHLGNREESLRLIDETFPIIEKDQSKEALGALIQINYACALIGDSDRFFKLSNYLVGSEIISSGELRDPAYKAMWEDPRYAEIMKRDALPLERGASTHGSVGETNSDSN